jgi:hypothetical protein
MELLPGTEVHARGLWWEVVSSEILGPETLFRLRGLENAVLGQKLDILYPFEEIKPVIHDPPPERAAPLVNWLVYHQAFLLEHSAEAGLTRGGPRARSRGCARGASGGGCPGDDVGQAPLRRRADPLTRLHPRKKWP